MHATKVDRSRETGSLVVCTCGLSLGPYLEHERALRAAREHRAIVAAPHGITPEQRARYSETQRRKRAEKRQGRDTDG